MPGRIQPWIQCGDTGRERETKVKKTQSSGRRFSWAQHNGRSLTAAEALEPWGVFLEKAGVQTPWKGRSHGSRQNGVNLPRLPKQPALHSSGQDQHLSGEVASQRIGGQKYDRVAHIFRAAELRQRHGGGDFSHD